MNRLLIGALCLWLVGPALEASFSTLTAVAAESNAQLSATETVYVTRTGEKYHRAGCRSLAKSSAPMALKDAAQRYGAKTILKIARALGPDVIDQLHRQVIEVAKRAGVTHGRRFRIDTTVVETNVHYPTDSTLLQDGIRVLTRTHSPRAYERSVNGFADLR
jgi:hypothetical protein